MSLAKNLKVIFIISLLSALLGCGASHTAINKRHLDVQTKMSSSVFLDPIAPEQKTILVQVRNTSAKVALDLQAQVEAALATKGYKIVSSPDMAHYLLQVNILQVGRCDLRAADLALNEGYGAALGGAAVGAAVGSLSSHNSDSLIIGGLIGGALAGVSDALVQDVSYSVVSDLQISERVSREHTVREKSQSKLLQGPIGKKELTTTEKTHWKRYQTRMISTANKVNLKFEQAVPALADSITHSIAGIF